MPQELISRRLRNMLRVHLSGVVLRKIHDEFEAAGISAGVLPPLEARAGRRTRVQQYYDALDFTNPKDARKFLDLLSAQMRSIERRTHDVSSSEDSGGTLRYLRECFEDLNDELRSNGYAYQNKTIVPITAAARLTDAKAIAHGFDAQHIIDQIQRIESSIDSDPALAVGTAKDLVESCFKTILAQHGLEYGRNEDLLQLGKKAFKALKLVPDDIADSAKGAETIRRMLNNMSTIVQGMAELRGLYGTGHGKDGRARGITPRHARLAVGAASTLVTFLFETDSETRRAQEPGNEKETD